MKGNEKLRLSGTYSSTNPSNFKENNRLDSTNFLPSGFPTENKDYKEDIDKRTFTSRTFEEKDGGVIIQYSSKNINYPDNEKKLQPISTSLSASTHIGNFEKEEKRNEKEKNNSIASASSKAEKVKEKVLAESGLGWSALNQEFPTYLYKDGSTALSSNEKDKIIFNKSCRINGFEIKKSDYTVGEEGMFISNVCQGIDKKIIFYENMIETDYIIRQPINMGNKDLVFSEEIELLEGYYISEASALNPLSKREGAKVEKSTPPFPLESGLNGETAQAFVVYSPDGAEKARFKTPVFYDADKAIIPGKYELVKQGGKNVLQIIVPGKWLNDINRVYPITVDPVVTGPMSNYPAVYMNSCEYPTFQRDSILVTIPADITITKFIVEDSYFADLLATPTPTMLDGYMTLSTVCGALMFSCSDANVAALPGTCYLVPNTDLKSALACCFSPACTTQTFYLVHGLARTNLGPGCNLDYIYYSPVSLLPPYPNTTFSAFIVGKTVETTQAEWSVSPISICSDICTVSLDVTTKYGVPPYTITHPWAVGSAQYGTSVGSCNSTGSHTLTLNIPGCPTNCGANTALSIPPPLIKDVCGDSVSGLSPKTITIKPVPVAAASPISVCSGTPFSIAVSSCVAGSSYQWTGSNGSSGTGNIIDNIQNTGQSIIMIDYSVIPTANGCQGPPVIVSAEIDTLPIINGGLNDTIEPGVSIQLNASGGLNYFWSPSAGLSCTNCYNPSAAPVISTAYTVTGTNEYGCSDSDTINIFVTQGGEVLYIPNSFSPNDNSLNDLFCVYGTSIKTIDIKIYDRWGELIFLSNDLKLGWDGKYKGKNVEGGVYVYVVNCHWMSGTSTYRNGIVTVVR